MTKKRGARLPTAGRPKRSRKPGPKAWNWSKVFQAVSVGALDDKQKIVLRQGCLNLDPEAIRAALVDSVVTHASSNDTLPQKLHEDDVIGVPLWRLDAVLELLTTHSKKLSYGKGKKKSVHSRAKNDRLDIFRFLLVLKKRKERVRFDDVYKEASKYPRQTPWGDHVGNEDAIRKAYERVSKRLRSNPEPWRYNAAALVSLSQLLSED